MNLAVALLALFSGAAFSASPSIVADYKLQQITQPSDPALAALAAYAKANLNHDDMDFFVISGALRASGKDASIPSGVPMIRVLNGRFDSDYHLNLKISDAQAEEMTSKNNGKLVVIQSYLQDSCDAKSAIAAAAKKIADVFPDRVHGETGYDGVPYASFDQAAKMILDMAAHCDKYFVDEYRLSDGDDAYLSLLVVYQYTGDKPEAVYLGTGNAS